MPTLSNADNLNETALKNMLTPKCTCTIEYDDSDPRDGSSAFIHYCPLHKAAGELLEALETVKRDWLSSIDRVRFAAIQKVDAAIAQVAGAG